MIGIFLLGWMGCNPKPVAVAPWTAEDALQPTFALLDGDQSGGVEPAEWARVSYAAPAFSELDSNATGALEPEELLAWVRRVDPDGFDGQRVPIKPNDGTVAGPAPVAREIRQVGDALLFLIEEIQGTPEKMLPAKEEVRDASWSMSMRSPESRAVLKKLRIAWDVAGREFPSGRDWGGTASEDPPGSEP